MTDPLVLTIISISLLIPFAFFAGSMAKSMNRRFWSWFFIGLVLPLVANSILACLPSIDRRKQAPAPEPVENDEIFNHLFIENINKKTAA